MVLQVEMMADKAEMDNNSSCVGSKKSLGILGLARRAGMLCYGADMVKTNLDRAFCLVVSCDVGDGTMRLASRLAQKKPMPLIKLSFSKQEMGRAIGRDSAAIVSVADRGFTNALMKTIGGS